MIVITRSLHSFCGELWQYSETLWPQPPTWGGPGKKWSYIISGLIISVLFREAWSKECYWVLVKSGRSHNKGVYS